MEFSLQKMDKYFIYQNENFHLEWKFFFKLVVIENSISIYIYIYIYIYILYLEIKILSLNLNNLS